MTIHVVQVSANGEPNKSLGRDIPPAQRGVQQRDSDIDANGILNVSAKDKAMAKSSPS